MRKTTKKKIAPIIVTAAVVLYMIPVVLLALSALGDAAQGSFGAALILLLYLFVGGAVIGGIMKALLQRLNEIDGGEEEEASQY